MNCAAEGDRRPGKVTGQVLGGAPRHFSAVVTRMTTAASGLSTAVRAPGQRLVAVDANRGVALLALRN